MRRKSVIALMVVVAACALPKETITIATFNIRIFSTGSRNDAELRLIRDLLDEYDFIAIQETRDAAILDRTRQMLLEEYGKACDYPASPQVGREIYAFLWRHKTP